MDGSEVQSGQGNDWARGRALAVLCVTQFMLVLDVNVVNVALPSIQNQLGFSEQRLQWVSTAYVVCFGGFLLLAGRAGDLVGRRRLYLVGLSVFTAGSLACGIAPNSWSLVAARAVQGIGAAIASPVALSIVMNLYSREGLARQRALALWSAAAPAGGATGLMAGGLLTQAWGWRAVFLINVPIGVAVLILAIAVVPVQPLLSPRSRPDVAGALTVTVGLLLLIYSLSAVQSSGFTLVGAAAGGITGLALLVLFIVIERSIRDPLVPLAVFRTRRFTGAVVAAFALTATTSPMGFLLALYLQHVLYYRPAQSGWAYLPVLLSVVAGSLLLGPLMIGRVGGRSLMVAGLVGIGLGTALLAVRLTAQGSYVSTVLPAGALYGLGLGVGSVASNISGTRAAPAGAHGLTSGILNTAAPLGTASGLALLVTIAAARTPTATVTGSGLLDGFRVAFAAAAIIAVCGAIATAAITPRDDHRRHTGRRRAVKHFSDR